MSAQFVGENNGIFTSLNQLPILDEIREIFYKNTGMTISFHYPGKGSAFDFYPSFERWRTNCIFRGKSSEKQCSTI